MTKETKGTCFPAVARIMCFPANLSENTNNFDAGSFPNDLVACHGLCICMFGKDKGKIIAHAWIEFKDRNGTFTGRKNINIAYDAILGTFYLAWFFHKTLKVQYVKRYKRDKFLALLWQNGGIAGPWDKHILTEMTPYESE